MTGGGVVGGGVTSSDCSVVGRVVSTEETLLVDSDEELVTLPLLSVVVSVD